MAFLIRDGHGHVGCVVVDVEADKAAENGPNADAFAEGGFACDADFREAARDIDVGGMALDHGGAEFIDLAADVLHHEGGCVIGDGHLDGAADRREGLGADARNRIAAEMKVRQLRLCRYGQHQHHHGAHYRRIKLIVFHVELIRSLCILAPLFMTTPLSPPLRCSSAWALSSCPPRL